MWQKLLLLNFGEQGNEELFKEESGVCEAIIDLFRDEYDKGVADAKEQGVELGLARGMERGIAQGITQGIAQGQAGNLMKNVKNLMNSLQVTTERACEMLGTTVEEYRKACELLAEDGE